MIALIHRIVPLGIRLQLMVWYTTVFAVLLLTVGAIFYQYLEHSLEGSLDTTLQIRAQQLAGGIITRSGTLNIQNGGVGDLPGFDPNPIDQQAYPAEVNYGVLVRLLDAHGTLVGETPAFRQLHVPLASVTQPLQGIPWQGTVLTTTTHQEVRLYSRVLTEQGKMLAVIQVGESLAPLHALLHELVGELLVAGLVVLLACALGSYWLAARAFAPIQRLAQTARRIKAGDLQSRVPVPRAHDEIRYLAQTLNEMIEALDQAFTRQRRFVADASHELRTPVAAIRSKTDLALRQAVLPQEYANILRPINTEAERLGRLISDLLALARGDEGQTRLDQEPLRLDLMAEVVMATAEPLAAERNITLRIHAPEPVIVYGDEVRLIQVLMNLLDNAIRYTLSGGCVLVSVERGRDVVALRVHDTGIGIAAEHLPHLFERFYRVDPARTRMEGGGSGLGLSIVEWVVQKHGGAVAVESQVGQGSIFTVSLPLGEMKSIEQSTA